MSELSEFGCEGGNLGGIGDGVERSVAATGTDVESEGERGTIGRGQVISGVGGLLGRWKSIWKGNKVSWNVTSQERKVAPL